MKWLFILALIGLAAFIGFKAMQNTAVSERELHRDGDDAMERDRQQSAQKLELAKKRAAEARGEGKNSEANPQVEESTNAADPVASLKEVASRFANRINADKPGTNWKRDDPNKPNSWVSRVVFESSGTPAIDVRKTDSLVKPFSGTIVCQITQQQYINTDKRTLAPVTHEYCFFLAYGDEGWKVTSYKWRFVDRSEWLDPTNSNAPSSQLLLQTMAGAVNSK